jgi:UDP-N-acetylmuramoyl-L-alanyl-D-glutamate--2,6-diaminopimelate ligase
MQLRVMLENVPNVRITGDPATPVRGLAYDSRAIEAGFLFAALGGLTRDGNDFVEEAVAKGAAAVLSARPAPEGSGRPGRPIWVQVDDDRLALALAARTYYGRPDGRLTVAGITGTNGKTTVCFLLESVLREAGLKPCLLGTVLYRYGRDEMKAERTTPESLDLFRLLDRFATAGARSCAMEVSSHSLALRRVAGIEFRVGVFTNLTQDHLDFHRTMDDYREAKARLFRGLAQGAAAVLNADDPAAAFFRRVTPARVVTFGESAGVAVRLREIHATARGTDVVIEHAAGRLEIHSALLGRPNAMNLLAAAAAGLALGLPPEAIVRGLAAVEGVSGRFERIDLGQPFQVLVDYAHTDDALRSLLTAVRALEPRRVLTVFGCGGDRDRGKRSRMGLAAASLSDVVVVTSDNPRGESPMAIIEEILPGVRQGLTGDPLATPDPDRCLVVPDRREAIRRALHLAAPGDCVVIAGKGHETYQILGDRTVPFDDREVARDLLRTRAGSGEGGGARAAGGPARGRARRP